MTLSPDGTIDEQGYFIPTEWPKVMDHLQIAHYFSGEMNRRKEFERKLESACVSGELDCMFCLIRNFNADIGQGGFTDVPRSRWHLINDGYLDHSYILFQVSCDQFNSWWANKDLKLEEGALLINWMTGNSLPTAYAQVESGRTWNEVTISLRANHYLAYAFVGEDGLRGKKALEDLGLFNKKESKPNKAGGILFKMRENPNRFFGGGGNAVSNSDRTAMSKLRVALKGWLGINDDPFIFNQMNGYRPRFNLADKRNAYTERIDKTGAYSNDAISAYEKCMNTWQKLDEEDRTEEAAEMLKIIEAKFPSIIQMEAEYAGIALEEDEGRTLDDAYDSDESNY